ncbi:MAG TPA: acyl-[ACP]--phospholipid O-acyltransferase [Aestuariivirgaceae bacterium]|nr:acyl-[ACP]--phospholipid O-acyltransferase [Aestuariivirgaceae bacterium]
MSQGQLSLLRTERFLPLFVTQALGAFNDNALRYAITILIVFDLAPRLGINGGAFVAGGTALFILPYFLFSATAGQIADKFDKAVLARNIKGLEIGIMLVGWASLHTDLVWLQMTVLFLAGVQAAFFSPVKYGLLPQHLARDELVGGNGLIEMTTFVSILLGTLFGGGIVLLPFGRDIVGAAVTGLAVVGYLMARRIPTAPPPVPELRVGYNLFAETKRIIGYAADRSDVFQAILGISWFWFVGALMMTLFPPFTRDVLHADAAVANLFIASFSIGIGLGSLLANAWLRGEISARYAPIAAILMTLFILDLYFASRGVPAAPAGGALATVGDMLAGVRGWRILVDLFGLAFFGGIYVVPLTALMQNRAAPPRRARVIAANNVVNAAFMTLSSILATVGFRTGMSVPLMFLVLAVANAGAALFCVLLLPQELVKNVGSHILRFLYRVEIFGMENVRAAGARAVVVANHQSFLDGALLAMFLPDRASFVVNTHVASRWYMRPARALFDIIPIDPSSPMALKTLIQTVRRGRKIVIFPEGRISVTGSLMKIYEGPGIVAHMARGRILPVRIEGAQYSLLSRMHGKLRLRPFPRITIHVLPPVALTAPADMRGSALRDHLALRLYDIMTDMIFKTSRIDQHLFHALLDARAVHGRKMPIMEDVQRKPLTFNRIVMGSFVLGRRLAAETRGERNVALLLPTAAATVVAMFGLLARGRVPAMLNFSTGAANMAAALAAAGAKTVVTSRRFVDQGQLEPTVAHLSEKARIVYLEDVRAKVGIVDKLYGALAALLPQVFLKAGRFDPDPQAPAVILFTSGSEGNPKGVALSHRNINANRHQIAARISFTSQDVAFNALPLFHAFGLTGGMLLPVLAGIRTFLYPSPLHYKIVPELAYDTDATVLFGTDTFLMGYAKNAHPYDFYAMRYVVAGAERVRSETRDLWMEKFGLRILEGYGCTECSPVLAVNTPLQFRSGTTGRLLDGIETRLEPVDGIERGGRLLVRGPNVMLGYLKADRPGALEPPPAGWYDTGDIVEFDPDGFLTIRGRAKRFSKIAGEMVSLGAVEARLLAAFPDHQHAIVAIPDPRKGEQLVLVTTCPDLDRQKLAEALKAQGSADIAIPRVVIGLPEIPLLGTGKTDYVTLGRLARERVEA